MPGWEPGRDDAGLGGMMPSWEEGGACLTVWVGEGQVVPVGACRCLSVPGGACRCLAAELVGHRGRNQCWALGESADLTPRPGLLPPMRCSGSPLCSVTDKPGYPRPAATRIDRVI